jgi:uncharacterized protein (TIGR00725 family)
MKQRKTIITVFGSGNAPEGEGLYCEALALGQALAAKGFVVCTGGYAGVMEAVSRGAKEGGGQTLAVTSTFFAAHANPWVDQEIRVKNWRDRLFELIKRGHGYAVCGGGTGTLAELAVVWEMLNKRVMVHKPVVVLGDFWKPVMDCVSRAELRDGAQRDANTNPPLHLVRSPAAAVEHFATHLSTKEPAEK